MAATVADTCWPRQEWLAPLERRKALAQPITRRLVVEGVGLYVDSGHRHVFVSRRGTSYSIVHIVVEGGGWAQIGSSRHRADAGTVVFFPAGIPHSYGSRDVPWSVWWCTFTGTDAFDLLHTIGITAANPVIQVVDTRRLVAMIEDMATLYEADQSRAHILEASATALKLITRINADRSYAQDSQPLEAAMKYLASHLDERVSIPALATAVGVSQARLNALFRSKTGESVQGYAIKLRMAKARRLLIETNDRIMDVARAVGYRDPYYFSRHFSRITGVSPSQFRQDISLKRASQATAEAAR